MPWEDCVVDVHSVKLSQETLEAMFSKCGAVRSVIHWRGHGEKQHVFMEYKSPSAADSARAIGLDRTDLQVIKLSNNEMLKRKFRELEKLSGSRPRSTCSSEQKADVKTNEKDYTTPSKLFVSKHHRERHAEMRTSSTTSEASKAWRGQSGPPSVSITTLSCSTSRKTEHSETFQTNMTHFSSSDNMRSSALSPTNSRTNRDLMKSDPQDSHLGRDSGPNSDHGNTSVSVAPIIVPKSAKTHPPEDASIGPKSIPTKSNISPTVMEIPHAGETIKFDLDKQLEPNPAGIICMLSTVKADQKLWMMTAAYYNGKQNLEAARKVLEAGIDMAVQTGAETDTKPFWHLLSEINSNLKVGTSAYLSASPASLTTSTAVSRGSRGSVRRSVPENLDRCVAPSMKRESHLLSVSSNPVDASSKVLNGPEFDAEKSTKSYPPLPYHHSIPFPQYPRLDWPNDRDQDLNLRVATPISPSEPMDASARIQCLQSEVCVLRQKQSSVLEDLSLVRAAKRRAEDEVKEERSIRRKLEKCLRAAEDALARSKRMEDAALDQVKREVEARRKAEELLTTTKAEKDRGGGASLFVHPSPDDAAMLVQLASILRNFSSNDLINPYQSNVATARNGAASSTAGNHPT